MHPKELPEYCIWDFNGTILDDVDTGIRAVNDLLQDRGLSTISSREEYQSVFGFPIQGYYERLGFDFSREPYELLAPLWVERYLHYVKEARMFEDVRRTLSFFAERGVRQIILSATERDMLCRQLKTLGIAPYFEEILGLDNIHAASKVALAKAWRERHPDVRAILIGDTDHDLATAEQMEAACVFIARGHQSAARLAELNCPIYPSLDEMLEKHFS